MTEDIRSLREHLADASLYADSTRAPSAGAWRGTLLVRYPLPAQDHRPESRAAELRQLLLRIALPLVLATAVAILAAFRVPLALPALPSTPPALPHFLSEAARFLPPGPWLWLSLGALSTLITFLARGRVPRLLPLDW